MSKSLNETIKDILKEDPTTNSATLKPGSKFKEAMPKTPADVVVIGDAPKTILKGEKNPDPLKGTKGKDKSKSSGSAKSVEAPKKLGEEEELVIEGDKKEKRLGNKWMKLVKKSEKVKKKYLKANARNEDVVTEKDILNAITEMEQDGLSEEQIKENVEEIMEGLEPITEEEKEESDDIITEEDLQDFVAELQEQGKSDEEIQEALDDVLKDDEEVINEEEETEEVPLEQPELDLEIDLSQDMAALFEGETLSDEFKEKAKLIFETVVKSRLTEYKTKLDEFFEAKLVEAVSEVEDKLSTDVEKYIDYVVENWLGENEVAIESSLRTELTEDFISGFRNLCLEHHIDLPEDKVNVLDEQAERITELEESLNEALQDNINLVAAINEAVKFEVFTNETDGLTAVETEKLRELAEGVEFKSEEDFAKNVKLLRENYFPNNALKNVDSLTEDEDGTQVLTEEKVLSPKMAKYASAIGKSLPN